MSVQETTNDYQFVSEPSQTVVVERTDNENYRISVGNPITGEVDYRTTTSWLKIDGVGLATSSMELSEYDTRIGITQGNNIELDV